MPKYGILKTRKTRQRSSGRCGKEMKNKHMSVEERIIIKIEQNKGKTFKEIGRLLGKDCTTISKEVRKHNEHKKTGAYGRGFNDCKKAYEHKCRERNTCERCISRNKKLCWSCGKYRISCEKYEKYICAKQKKAPYVCNGCKDQNKCSLEKVFYHALPAQRGYEKHRSESRTGFNITESELTRLDKIVSPLLKKGQSLHHIAISHADKTMKSERTLYKYVNNGLFTARNIDMPRTVRMRPRKGKPKAFKVDKGCRIGRTYNDYLKFCNEHPTLPIRQIDSLEGVKGGAVLLTIHFVQQQLQLAFIRSANDSQSVIDIFEDLYLKLGTDTFMNIFPVLLADNGSEFSNPQAIEYSRQGNKRTQMFYCDPSAPYQKPNCENNHEMIRRCIPKGVDLGKYSQEQISLMMSHINSYARPNLGDKSPFEVFAFQYSEDILHTLGIKKIQPEKIILTPRVFD